MNKIQVARAEWEDLGFDPIPLRPGTKKPMSRGWQRQPIGILWNDVPPNANIGLRCGGDSQFAVIDCDDPKTFQNAEDWLASLGYLDDDYPVIKTASEYGRQIYIKFSGHLEGNSRKFKRGFGPGEFRFGIGAQVVAEPSQVEGVTYNLLRGDYRQLPHLYELPPIQRKIFEPNLNQRAIPRRAMELFQGKRIEEFLSRSEAEQSLIVSLINANFGFESILTLFEKYQAAGKFQELREIDPQNAVRWLRLSYDRALQWATSNQSDARQIAQRAITWAENTPWTGKTGPYDQAVYIAHASVAKKAGRIVYSASARDLAELAGISYMASTNATHRLIDAGLLKLVRSAIADYANIYELIVDGQSFTLPHNVTVRECEALSTALINHDAFRYRGLGKSAAQVYAALTVETLTEDELAGRTGRNKKTVSRALDRMSGLIDSTTGEIISMVESDGKHWYLLEVDLDYVAWLVGTTGIGKRQQKKHRDERRAHRRVLRRFRKLDK